MSTGPSSHVLVLSAICGVTAATALLMLAIRRIRARGVRFCDAQRLMEGKHVLITGANAGLGAEFAYEMARRKAIVHLACRNREKALATMESIEKRCLSMDGFSVKDRLKFWPLDMSSLESVGELSSALHKELDHLDVLMANAGIMNHPRAVTADGIEMHFGVNHLAHFLLAQLVLDLVTASPDGRICVISSGYHQKAKKAFHAYLDEPPNAPYSGLDAYANSKLANVLHVMHLAKHVQPHVNVYAIRPGFVRTELGRHFSRLFSTLAAPLIWAFAKNVHEGVQTYLHCVLAEAGELTSGQLYNNCQLEPSTSRFVSEQEAARLWELSERFIKEKCPGLVVPGLTGGGNKTGEDRKKSSNESSGTEDWVKA